MVRLYPGGGETRGAGAEASMLGGLEGVFSWESWKKRRKKAGGEEKGKSRILHPALLQCWEFP